MTMELKAIDLKGRYFPPGEVLADRFRIGERMGEGVFGQVYRAEDTLIETEVAVKIFAAGVVRSPLEEEQFLKATRRARALTQKNVVRLHDSGVHKDHPWVSMQLLEGLNLRKVVRLRHERKERFSLQELEPILSQITLALQHVARDEAHGNLKPENIVFLPDLLKITDSYVRSALPEEVFAERNNASRFIAPELLTPGGQADPRCDVYSVGAIIGYMLFGEDYAPGDGAREEGLLSTVDALCRRAMAFDPVERYSSVEALNEDFTSLVDTGALLQRRVPSGPVSGSAQASPVTAPSGPPSPTLAPPPPPAAPPSGPINPLDIETPTDIGQPPKQVLTTAEYDRSDSLGDLLPTNEVDRTQFPEPSSKPEKAPGPKAGSEEKQAAKKPEPTKPAPKPEAKKPAPKPEVKKPAPKPEAKKPAAKKTAEESSSSTAMIIGGVVLAALFVLIIVVTGNDDRAEREAEARSPEVVEVSEVAEEVESEEPIVSAEEAEALAREWEEMIAQVSTIQNAAIDAASGMATKKAEEIKKKEEEAAAATVAQAEPSGRAGAAQQQQGAAAPARGGSAQAAATGTNCPSGMVLVRAGDGNVCVDAYQYPGRGRMPEVRVSWFDARRLCQQQGKRLCSLSEWRTACGRDYPYGRNFDANRCNTADEDGFERSLAAAGSFPGCRSPSGAFDMSGNVHEWVEEQRVAGGGYDSEADLASCRYSSPKAPASADPNVGFRCCQDPN